MDNLLHNFFKTLFAGIFIGAGIGLPTLISSGHFLECQPDPQTPGETTSPSTATCEILQIGGGTLFTKGTQVLDRQRYQKIRQAEVAIITAKQTTRTQTKTVHIEKLVLVGAKGKQTVDFRFPTGIVNTIVSQINRSIATPRAPKFSIEIGQPDWLPQAIGWTCVMGSTLIFFAKPTPPMPPE